MDKNKIIIYIILTMDFESSSVRDDNDDHLVRTIGKRRGQVSGPKKNKKRTKKRVSRKRQTRKKTHKKRVKRKTTRRTKRKVKRSVKRYSQRGGTGMADYKAGNKNTCLYGAIVTVMNIIQEDNPTPVTDPLLEIQLDKFLALQDQASVKVSLIRHTESTSNTQYKRKRGEKSKQLALAAGVAPNEADKLDWGGSRFPSKNEAYWGYTHAFLTGYGRTQAYSTGYYKLWEIFCGGDYDMDFFCSVLPRACQSAKLATKGFIQRLKDTLDARTRDNFEDDMRAEIADLTPPEQIETFITMMKTPGFLEALIAYYGLKLIKITNGISETPMWNIPSLLLPTPNIPDTQRCMREDLLPDMVLFLNKLEDECCELVLDGLDEAFADAAGNDGGILRPRNYLAVNQDYPDTYMTDDNSIFSFLFNLPQWFQRTVSETTTLQGSLDGIKTVFPQFNYDEPSEKRNVCFVHGIMMLEYMPWPLFTNMILDTVSRPSHPPPSEPEPGVLKQGGDSEPPGEESSKIPHLSAAARADIFMWPPGKDITTHVAVLEEIGNWLAGNVWRPKDTIIHLDGRIIMGATPIFNKSSQEAIISLPKTQRSGRPYCISIHVTTSATEERKKHTLDLQTLDEMDRFLRDAMCIGCKAPFALKKIIFTRLLENLKKMTSVDAKGYESMMRDVLFYGEYTGGVLTAATVKHAIENIEPKKGNSDMTCFNLIQEFDDALKEFLEKCMDQLTLEGKPAGWKEVLKGISDHRDEECFKSSFLKQPANATCVSFELKNFPSTGLQRIYSGRGRSSPVGITQIDFWSLFLYKNVKNVSFLSPPLRLKMVGEMAMSLGADQHPYKLLAAQIKQADVNNYYHTNPMLIMVFKEVSRLVSDGSDGAMINAYRRCHTIIQKALKHVKADWGGVAGLNNSAYYFPLAGGRHAHLTDIFGGGWSDGWGFDANPVSAQVLDTHPEGQCLKETTVTRIKEARYAKIEGNSLNFYGTRPPDGGGDVPGYMTAPSPADPKESSLKSLIGCEVTQVWDSEKQYHFQIQITGITNVNSDNPPASAMRKINFANLQLADQFYIALRNLSKEREWNYLHTDISGAATEQGFEPGPEPDPEPDPEPGPEPDPDPEHDPASQALASGIGWSYIDSNDMMHGPYKDKDDMVQNIISAAKTDGVPPGTQVSPEGSVDFIDFSQVRPE